MYQVAQPAVTAQVEIQSNPRQIEVFIASDFLFKRQSEPDRPLGEDIPEITIQPAQSPFRNISAQSDNRQTRDISQGMVYTVEILYKSHGIVDIPDYLEKAQIILIDIPSPRELFLYITEPV
jgi:hypothetical protein